MPLMGGNPFWSERARDELRLQMSRPEDLPADGQGQPVPGDDEEVGRQLEEDSGLEAMENGSEGGSRGEPRQERRRGRARSRLGTPTMETTFTTPESWTNQGAVNRGPLRTAGMMPVDSGGGSRPGRGEPLRSQGVAFSADREGDDLQREVEKEMVQTLLEENEQLKHQMGQMKEWMKKIEEKSGYSDWSEVTVESPRAKREKAHGVEALRYTPNGTQVPAGPPPLGGDEDRPPVPLWPFPEWEIYEKDGKGHPRRMEIDSAEWQLQRGLYGGGASPRHKDCGRGTSSRQDVRQQEVGGSLGIPQIDRERWLLRELVQLQQALDSEKKSKVRWRVDEDGHLRELAQSRAQLQVDARPEESSVWSYSECLLAELESLRLLQGSTATSKSGTTATTTPAVKMLGTKSSTTSACKFWGSDTGCRQGKRCSYLHDWASLEDRNNRCFLCSSTAHRKADCPTRAVGDGTNPTGGSGGGGQKGKGNGKNKSKAKTGGEEPAASTKGKGNGSGAGSSTPQSSSGLQEASLKAMQGTGAPSSAESVAGSTTSKPESLATEKELMGEVASLLKTLRVGDGNSNPQLSAVRLARILNHDKAVLIDGGATHCLRNPHSREEYLNHAEEVRVDLAAGSVRMRQDTGTGTLYSEDPNLQPIVPLADVIKVGVVVKWDSSGCEMRYRSGEKLPVFLQDGCPMLPMQRGMELLYEVEEFNRRKLKLRRAVTHPQPDHDREEEFMSRLTRLFPEVPLRILERVPGKINYDNDIMGINRRTRRQVERAETVILNLFSGPNTKIWTSHGQKDS